MASAPLPETSEATSSQTVRALLRLREMILAGELAPGERLSEPVMAEATGISRTPIRTALVRLQEEGLLEPIQSGGFRVRAFSLDEIRDAIQIRATLEGLSARLAAERGVAPELLEMLADCVDQIDEVLADDEALSEARFAAYVDGNARFHELIAGACGSEVVRRQVERAMALPFASPNGFLRVQAVAPDALHTLRLANAQHRAVVEALAGREGARAEALMREHARIPQRNLETTLAHPAIRELIPGASLIVPG
ncbi:FCD domain-containing protein [Azoarcus indigens]|uniref:GntR family transcriptional regulator n=1 Tax=Azoarcus indigens TaxID=29545 RepID=A0A4R6E0U0_9RHOO|nr:GntR family transcriptional regulator [Azoarcus indigens]NMG66498.1 FCD domain-containing protein [Azoarcus indigens]TDN51315.1 GntR family transcriptional regulator [Azoarcus indigens]